METKAADELVGDVQSYIAGLDWEERQNRPFSTIVGLFPPAPCIVYVALFRKSFIPTSCKEMVPAACLQPTAYSCSVTSIFIVSVRRELLVIPNAVLLDLRDAVSETVHDRCPSQTNHCSFMSL